MNAAARKALKALKYFLFSVGILLILLIIFINLPFVHTLITNKANSWFAENNIPVSVGSISISLTGKLKLHEIKIIKSKNDTIIYAGDITAKFRVLPLLSNNLHVESLSLKNGVVQLESDSAGNLNLLSLFPSAPEDTMSKKTSGSSWEVVVQHLLLENIRFSYSDPGNGIELFQSLQTAEVSFDKFSILEQEIHVNELKILKSEGLVTLSDTPADTTNDDSPSPPWKFSARDIQLTDVSYTYTDKENQQQYSVKLKKINSDLEQLHLSEQKLLVSKLILDEPIVSFSLSKIPDVSNDTVNTSSSISITSPWAISCAEVDIVNGEFRIESAQDSTLADWYPVRNFNTSIKDAIFYPDKAGCQINRLSCSFNNKLKIHSGKLVAETDSSLHGKFSLDLLASMSNPGPGNVNPDTIQFSTKISGSPELLSIEQLELAVMPDARVNCSGTIKQLLNIPESRIDLGFRTSSITRSQVSGLLSFIDQEIKLPEFSSFALSGKVGNTMQEPQFNILVNSASANLNLKGKYNTKSNYCALDASFDHVKMASLFGNDLPETISGMCLWKGTVTDINGEGEFHIENIIYNNIQSNDLHLSFKVANNQSLFAVTAADSALACELSGQFNWNENSYDGQIEGMFSINEREADWVPGNAAASGGIKGTFLYSPQTTDASVDLINLNVRKAQTAVLHDSISWDLLMLNNSVKSELKSDFLSAEFNCNSSLDAFASGINKIGLENFLRPDTSDFIDAAHIAALPSFNLNVNADYDSLYTLFMPDTVFKFNNLKINVDKSASDQKTNFSLLVDSIRYLNYTFHGTNLAMTADQKTLHGTFDLDSLNVDGVSSGHSHLELDVLPKMFSASIRISDTSNTPLYQLGLVALKETTRIRIRTEDSNWILNANTWQLSTPEFFILEIPSGEFIASAELKHEKMSIALNGHSSDSLKMELENVKISEMFSQRILQNIPDGILNATIVYSNRQTHYADFNIDIREMEYKEISIEHITANGFFSQDTSGVVKSDLTALINDSSSVKMTVSPGENSKHQVITANFTNVPVKLLEPFSRESVKDLDGLASGELRISGDNTKPAIDGHLNLKAITLTVVPLQAWFTIPEDKIVIKSSQASFENFVIRDSLNKELKLNGTLNLEDPENITSDLMVNLNNFRIMNTTEKDNPEFFGEVIVNSGLKISGPIVNPAVKGSIKLEEGTEITYREVNDVSVQETQTYVTFASLSSDSVKRPAPILAARNFSGIPIVQTEIEIDPKSIFHFEITSGYDINIEISGSGLLDYTMLPNNTMSLTGSYEIKDGKANLKFPGWPIKRFAITKGSYLRWNGDVSDPEINLEATSKVEGSYINPVDSKTRYVDFIVSMKLSEQLSRLNVYFDVKSPDQYIMSVLNALPEEERMRQAINLLIFESINLPNIESSSNYLDSQINSFWENQLNALTKTNFKNVELSFGIDTYTQTSSTGAEEDKTSLSYEVERKFLNDRASVKLSGRFNDGSEAGNTSNTMLENFTLEYELDTMERKFLKLYTKKDYEDILDGEVTKSGVGFIYRKSYPDFKSIWKRKKKALAVPEQKTSDIE